MSGPWWERGLTKGGDVDTDFFLLLIGLAEAARPVLDIDPGFFSDEQNEKMDALQTALDRLTAAPGEEGPSG